MRDIREVFGDEKFLPTTTLLNRLCDLEESPWNDLRSKPLDPRVLSEMLGDYEIARGQQRVGAKVSKGYHRHKFEDAWERYLLPPEEERNQDEGDEATSPPPPGKSDTPDTSDTAIRSARVKPRHISRSLLTSSKSSRKSTPNSKEK